MEQESIVQMAVLFTGKSRMKNFIRLFVLIYQSVLIVFLLVLGLLLIKMRYSISCEQLDRCMYFGNYASCSLNNYASNLLCHNLLEKIIISDKNFITVIVCLTSIIMVSIVCFIEFSIRTINQLIFLEKKQEIASAYKKIELHTSEYDSKITEKKSSEFSAKYYPVNKASVDLFKAYATTIENI